MVLLVVLGLGLELYVTVAIPLFRLWMPARPSPPRNAQRRACINNLRNIVAAKKQCAIENNNNIAKWTNHVKGGALTCPTNGRPYRSNPRQLEPTCPNAAMGHMLGAYSRVRSPTTRP